ncbi:helix-turn-helix transcriptional regulator [Nocardiopsis chromatogenes]|uniref:helix-turn-helix transcriptional regulator n=1 Tax=Nocardiopsis chromatogenes TaxID=280239 RepID=UPI00034A4467|nr:helix-turn-helix transcriptional regulator [Nocardiopsis chromatogenes]
MRERYRVNARVGMRLARGWSQRQVAEMWSERWPADPKSDKAISYWELWPGPTGYEPSLTVLGRLAELYECHIVDLLADGPDHRSGDGAHRAHAALAPLAGESDEGAVEKAAEQVAALEVHEIAAAVTRWTARLGEGRRGPILKLSAALSLAATLPDDAEPEPEPASPGPDYTGVWRSRYLYTSSSRGPQQGEHYVVLRQDGPRLLGQSLPHTTGSRLELTLTISGMVASGTWSEKTSPTGHYRGAEYHGTLQLLVNPSGREMAGRWVGFGKNFKVNTGEWDLTWVDHAVSQRVVREYHMRL